MGATAALLRENPGLLITALLLAVGAIAIGVLTLAMARTGASARPALFVAGMYALVVLPQFAFHLGVATGAIPKRNLTWLPASERARVHGWVENDAALATRDGAFVDPVAAFGPGVDPALGTDLRAAGAGTPFANAEAARLALVPPNGSTIVARYATPAAAADAARRFADEAFGAWPEPDADGLRSATRPAGDRARLALAGRTFVVVAGADDGELFRRLSSLGAIAPGRTPPDPRAAAYWLYRPGVLPALAAALVVLYLFAFFRGAAWASAVGPRAVPPVTAAELRRRLLAVDAAGAPFTVVEEGGRLVATWRFADARWLDFASARRLRAVQRVVLEVDPAARVVHVSEQQSRYEADAGLGRASFAWQLKHGVTFFELQQGRVFGVQFDEHWRPVPRLDYTYRFDVREMKAPLVEVVTGAGWQWRPAPWRGPAWLRWLTG